MKLRACKALVVESLRESIGDNLEFYRSGTFDFLVEDASCYLEMDVQASEKLLQDLDTLTMSKEDLSSADEANHCAIVFSALRRITPYLARDERLWVYLTHTLLLEYSRKRWPIPADDEKAINHIRTHFFARSARQIERDNAVSRLWWIAYLCSRSNNLDLQRALDVFLFRSDVRASIVERPTTAQSLKLFDAILSHLSASYDGDKRKFERNTLRGVMGELNRLGGVKLIEVLPDSDLETIVSDAFTSSERQTALEAKV